MLWKKYKIYLEPAETHGIYKTVYIIAKKDIGIYTENSADDSGDMIFHPKVLPIRELIPFKVEHGEPIPKILQELINGSFQGHLAPFETKSIALRRELRSKRTENEWRKKAYDKKRQMITTRRENASNPSKNKGTRKRK